MSSLTSYQALRTWFDSVWHPTVILYENERIPAPDDLSPFIYFETRGRAFSQRSIGSLANLWREDGYAYFYVCVPSGTGIELMRGYCSAIVDLLKGLTLSPGIICRSITVGISGPYRDNGNYLAIPVISTWQRDEAV